VNRARWEGKKVFADSVEVSLMLLVLLFNISLFILMLH
jgi:hypothetical protein